jgi:hypothetical protein
VTPMAVLVRDPICKACDKELSTQADHIVPLEDGGDPTASKESKVSVISVTGPRPRERTRPGEGGVLNEAIHGTTPGTQYKDGLLSAENRDR